jgi:hypothetical protein
MHCVGCGCSIWEMGGRDESHVGDSLEEKVRSCNVYLYLRLTYCVLGHFPRSLTTQTTKILIPSRKHLKFPAPVHRRPAVHPRLCELWHRSLLLKTSRGVLFMLCKRYWAIFSCWPSCTYYWRLFVLGCLTDCLFDLVQDIPVWLSHFHCHWIGFGRNSIWRIGSAKHNNWLQSWHDRV